jgi:hypothetical protein
MFKVESDKVTITEGNHTLEMERLAEGGFVVRGNGISVAEVRFGGGRFQLHLSGDLPLENNPDVGFAVDGDGYIHVEKS